MNPAHFPEYQETEFYSSLLVQDHPFLKVHQASIYKNEYQSGQFSDGKTGQIYFGPAGRI